MSTSRDFEEELEAQLLKAQATASLGQRALSIVKEWGGVATVLIAILYTFPFEVFDRIINWEEHDVVAARKVLVDVVALRADEIIALDKLQDRSQLDFLANMYEVRLYNLLRSNANVLKMSILKLTFSELYTIGSSFALSAQIDQSLPFYEGALSTYSTEKNLDGSDLSKTTILREYGRTLFQPSIVQNIERARQLYASALQQFDSDPRLINTESYLPILYEYGSLELIYGDRACGRDIASRALGLVKRVAQADQNNKRFASNATNFEADFASKENVQRVSVGKCAQVTSGKMLALIETTLPPEFNSFLPPQYNFSGLTPNNTQPLRNPDIEQPAASVQATTVTRTEVLRKTSGAPKDHR